MCVNILVAVCKDWELFLCAAGPDDAELLLKEEFSEQFL